MIALRIALAALVLAAAEGLGFVSKIADWAVMSPLTGALIATSALAILIPDPLARWLSGATATTCVVVLATGALPAVGYGATLAVVSPFGAALILVLAVSRLAATPRSHRPRLRTAVVEFGALSCLPPVLVVLLGYAFTWQPITGSDIARVLPLPAAVAVGLLSVATLNGTADGVLAWVRAGTDSGAKVLRRVVPTTALVLPLIAAARLEMERLGWFGIEVGLGIMTTSGVVAVAIACWVVARPLRKADRERDLLLDELRSANLDLDRRVRRRAAELAQSRHESELARDRERISADLHDLVIQRLFGAALLLQARGSAGTLSVDDAEAAIDAIDAAISELRGTIFNLRSASPMAVLKQTMIDAVDLAEGSEIATELRVIGSVEALPSPIAVHLAAVLRECVSNAIRHSGGSRLTIKILIADEDVTLLVADNGRGMHPDVEAPSGLRNVRARALDLGGHATWAVNAPVGTRVTWTVPLQQGATAPDVALADPATDSGPSSQLDVDALADALVPLVDEPGPLPGHGWNTVDDATYVPEPIRRLARTVCALFEADRFAVVTELPDDRDRLVVAYCENFPDSARGLQYRRDASLVAQALSADHCLTFAHVATASATGAQLLALPDGSAIIIPVVAGAPGDGTSLAFTLLRDEGRAAFGPPDVAKGQEVVAALRPRLLGRTHRRRVDAMPGQPVQAADRR